MLTVVALTVGVFGFVHFQSKYLLPEIVEKKVPYEITIEKGALLDIEIFNRFMLLDEQSEIEKPRVKKFQGSLVEVTKTSHYSGSVWKNNCDQKCVAIPVPLKNIPTQLWQSLIGIEDYRFLDHQGVDPFALLRATIVNLMKGRFAQGGSTLTQQLVKNLFLTREKTISRKVKEAFISVYIDSFYSKEEIIEAYLNRVYWGSVNGLEIRGAYLASIYYFGKKLDELDLTSSLILVSMLKGPGYYSPLRHLDRLKGRVNAIFRKLQEIGYVLEDEALWSDFEWEEWLQYLNGNQGRNIVGFLQNVSSSDTGNIFDQFIIQTKASEVLQKIYKRTKHDKELSFTGIIKLSNGEQLISQKGLGDRNERHQIGSILKPIFYSKIFEEFDPADEIETAVKEFEIKSGTWAPKNSGRDIPEVVTLEYALQNSLNVPLVRAVENYGFDELEKEVSGMIPRFKKPLREFPAQLLGSIELSVNEVFEIYEEFFHHVCKTDGGKKVINILSTPLKTTIKGRVRNLGNARFFGKTGTSNRSLDNWFIFYDGQELGVFWLGHRGKKDIPSLRTSGAGSSFEILKGYLLARGKRIGELTCP